MDNVVAADAPTIENAPTTVDEFEALVARTHNFGGCSAEIHLPPPILKAHVAAHLVEEKNGVWQPTGRIVNLENRWGLSVTFCMYGPLARIICGDLDLTASWDGYAGLPEGKKAIENIRVDCNNLPCVTRVIDLTGHLTCPTDEGVYDFGICAELTDVCRRETTIVIGVCNLQGVKLYCKHS